MLDRRRVLVTASSLAIALVFGGLIRGEIVVDDPLVLLPDPPVGFKIWTQRIETADRVLGVVVAMGRDAPGSSVTISIETAFDRSNRPARVAATKGYINGTFQQLRKGGFALQKKSLPDLDQITFDRPMECEFEYSSDNSGRLYVYQKIAFTDKGFNMQVMAKDPKDFAALKKWLDQVQIPPAHNKN
jgi:hypothetical protein